MPFDVDRFSGATLSLRTQRVAIKESALLQFFDDGETAEVVLRQLDGVELSRCLDAERINTDMEAIIGALIAGESPDKADAIKDMLGIGGRVPNDIAKRIEMLTLGSVEPRFDREAALRICRFFPVEFHQWTNIIQNLSGAGATLGESNGSGQTRPSGSRRRSAGSSESLSLN